VGGAPPISQQNLGKGWYASSASGGYRRAFVAYSGGRGDDAECSAVWAIGKREKPSATAAPASRYGELRLAAQHQIHIAGGHRFSEVVTLSVLASPLGQLAQGGRILDAFGDRRYAEALRKT
jgi:hypothetical protein